jgi:hypothetical protein
MSTSRHLRKDDPPGTFVFVVEDNGVVTETRTRSHLWSVCGSEVVLLEDRSGGYLATRCSVRRPFTQVV